MKKKLSIILIAAMLVALIPASVFATGATGTENTFDPGAGQYGITTEADFLAFNAALVKDPYAFVDKTVYLNADIAQSDTTVKWGNCAFGGGTFDGRGHVISNLNLTGRRGLFAFAQGTIQNFTLKDSKIVSAGTTNLGAIVAGNSITVNGTSYNRTEDLTIRNVHVINTTITGDKCVGGIIGNAYSSTALGKSCIIDSCMVRDVTITAGGNGSGGLVGEANPNSSSKKINLTISNCYVSGLTLMGSGNHKGGLTGRIGNGTTLTVKNCFASGTNSAANAGGVIGWVNTGITVTLTNVYSDMRSTATTQTVPPILYVNSGAPVLTFTNVFTTQDMGTYANGIYYNGTSSSAATSAFTNVSTKTLKQVLAEASASTEQVDVELKNAIAAVLQNSVFSIGWQAKNNGDGTYDYRLIYGLRDKNAVDPSVLGSVVKINDRAEQSVNCGYAYTSLQGTNAAGTVETYQASDYGADYLFVIVIEDVPASVTSFQVELTPYLGYAADDLYQGVKAIAVVSHE